MEQYELTKCDLSDENVWKYIWFCVSFHVCNLETIIFNPIQARLLSGHSAQLGQLSKRFITSSCEKLQLRIMINDQRIKHSSRDCDRSWIEIRLVVHEWFVGSMLENSSC